MRLSELLTPDHIRVPLKAGDKEGVLRELVGMALAGDGPQAEEVLGAILERERQFPTGIGYGVAVPHGKTPIVPNLVVVAGPLSNRCRTKRSTASRCDCFSCWPGRSRRRGRT